MKPGVERHTTAVLPHASAVALTVSTTSGAVARPRTTSTSAMTGAGLKKCMPTMRSGCLSPAASAVIDSDEVLLAKMASAWRKISSVSNRRTFAVEILDDRLDHQAGRRQRIEAVTRLDPGERAALLVGARRPLSTARASAPAIRSCGLRQGGLVRVVEEHGMARGRGHLRDPAAHGAGADHGDGNRRCERCHHRPLNVGGRFAMNAATPSR